MFVFISSISIIVVIIIMKSSSDRDNNNRHYVIQKIAGSQLHLVELCNVNQLRGSTKYFCDCFVMTSNNNIL
jgi:hypothetical protein